MVNIPAKFDEDSHNDLVSIEHVHIYASNLEICQWWSKYTENFISVLGRWSSLLLSIVTLTFDL